MKSTYTVTASVNVIANNTRHAAHIAKGIIAKLGEGGANIFEVQQHVRELGPIYRVNLSKELGEDGYLEAI